MLQNDISGFPGCEQKKYPYHKHVKMEEGSRKLRKKDSTERNDSFAINLLPPKQYTYIHTHTPHMCICTYVCMHGVYVCMRVCCKCVYMQSCVLHVCAVCVYVCKRRETTITNFYVHAHTQNASKVARNSTVQGYATANH